MSTERIAEEVIAVIARKLEIPAAQIDLDDDLISDLGADSLALAELSMLVEEHFQTKINIDEMVDVATVRDLVELFQRRQVDSSQR